MYISPRFIHNYGLFERKSFTIKQKKKRDTHMSLSTHNFIGNALFFLSYIFIYIRGFGTYLSLDRTRRSLSMTLTTIAAGAHFVKQFFWPLFIYFKLIYSYLYIFSLFIFVFILQCNLYSSCLTRKDSIN